MLAKSEGKTPLEVTAQGGHLDMAQYLLDRGASIIDGDTQPLGIAVQKGHLDMAQLLWETAEDGCAGPSRREIPYI